MKRIFCIMLMLMLYYTSTIGQTSVTYDEIRATKRLNIPRLLTFPAKAGNGDVFCLISADSTKGYYGYLNGVGWTKLSGGSSGGAFIDTLPLSTRLDRAIEALADKNAVKMSDWISNSKKVTVIGDVVTNLVDEFTGEPVTFKRFIGIAFQPVGDADVDSIMIVKWGGHYYRRTTKITAKNFGVRTGDFTAGEINQKAYNKYARYCARWGEKMILPDGLSIVSGRIDRTGVYAIEGESINALVRFFGNDGFWWNPKIYAENVTHANFRVDFDWTADRRSAVTRRGTANEKIGNAIFYFGSNNTVKFDNVRCDGINHPDETTDHGTCFFYASGATYKLKPTKLESRQEDYGIIVGFDENSGDHAPRVAASISTVTNRITFTDSVTAKRPFTAGDVVLAIWDENGATTKYKPRVQYIITDVTGNEVGLALPGGDGKISLQGVPGNMYLIPASNGPDWKNAKVGTDYSCDEWVASDLTLVVRQRVMSVPHLGGYSRFDNFVCQRGHGSSIYLTDLQIGPLWGGGGNFFGGVYDEGPFSDAQSGKLTHLIETHNNVFSTGFWMNRGEEAAIRGNGNIINGIVNGKGSYKFTIEGSDNVLTGVMPEYVVNMGINNKIYYGNALGKAIHSLKRLDDNSFHDEVVGGFAPDAVADGMPDLGYISNSILFYPMANMLSGYNAQQKILKGAPDAPVGFQAYAYDDGPYKEVILQYPKGENVNNWSSKYLPRTKIRGYAFVKNSSFGTARLLFQGFAGIGSYDREGTRMSVGKKWTAIWQDFDFTGAPDSLTGQFRVTNDNTADTIKVSYIYFKPIPTETRTRTIYLTDTLQQRITDTVLSRNPITGQLEETIVKAGLDTSRISADGNVQVSAAADGKVQFDLSPSGEIQGRWYYSTYDQANEDSATILPMSRTVQLVRQFGSPFNRNGNDISFGGGSVNLNGTTIRQDGFLRMNNYEANTWYATSNGNDRLTITSGTGLRVSTPVLEYDGYLQTNVAPEMDNASNRLAVISPDGRYRYRDATSLNTLDGASFSLNVSGSPRLRSSTGMNGAINGPHSTSGANAPVLAFTGTLSGNTGIQYITGHFPTIRESSTAGFVLSAYYPYLETLGSGRKTAIAIGTASSPGGTGTLLTNYSIDVNGSTFSAGTQTIATAAAPAAPAAGSVTFRYDGSEWKAYQPDGTVLTVLLGKVVTNAENQKYLETKVEGASYLIFLQPKN